MTSSDVRIIKLASPSGNWGHGTDNTYTPGRYRIVRQGRTVGYISAQSRKYRDNTTIWAVTEMSSGKTIADFPSYRYKQPFRKAKAFAMRHFGA